MQFRNLIPAFAGLAAAATVEDGTTFGLMALRSASDVHFAQFRAALSSIFLNLPEDNASCDAETDGSATFYIQDGEMYLYAASATPQQLFVDRSGMGQGKLGYTTGAQPGPRNGERKGFEIDETGNLSFNGASFIACPNSIDGAHSVWVSAGVNNPGGNKDCVGVVARTVEIDEPVGCLYTQ